MQWYNVEHFLFKALATFGEALPTTDQKHSIDDDQNLRYNTASLQPISRHEPPGITDYFSKC